MELYKMVFSIFLAHRTIKTQSPINNIKKKTVPEKKGKPNKFTKATSKLEAMAMEPGMMPS